MLGIGLNRKGLAAGAVSVMVLGAALAPGLALAQTPDAGTTTQEAGHRHGPRGLHGAALEEVADTLGVTADTLREAMRSVKEALKPAERPTEPPTEEEREAKRAEFHAALAAELGVTAAAVEAAFEAAQPTEEEIAAFKAERIAEAQERIADALAEGRITQEQADAALERIESGERPFGAGGRRGHGPGGFGGIFGTAPLGDAS